MTRLSTLQHGHSTVHGNAPPQVAWLHDGQVLMDLEDFHLLREDTGIYSCRAWNQYGENHTQATLAVEGNHRTPPPPV
ncbi:hypothetical protein Q5P01_014224 [Channa striata]|uniref:Ig-like domain-containing protein n=1 Tax=Channa striata TaxID=64152 RepID=A0AA88MQH5_CHASR|nr:hypothetical protein Q5P01_014224 [Channa striata]